MFLLDCLITKIKNILSNEKDTSLFNVFKFLLKSIAPTVPIELSI